MNQTTQTRPRRYSPAQQAKRAAREMQYQARFLMTNNPDTATHGPAIGSVTSK